MKAVPRKQQLTDLGASLNYDSLTTWHHSQRFEGSGPSEDASGGSDIYKSWDSLARNNEMARLIFRQV